MASEGGKAEKILVSVRVRPLNEKETTRNNGCDWECINDDTIICNNNTSSEKSLFPSSYTYDKVFGFDCSTNQVYHEGAKDVALSALTGINSSIFAYGQTGSGKTYTMSGITEFAMNDIFDYVEKHKEREFTLRFSAIEIYNEAVRDLLSGDNTPLRLLDDPVKGTTVEKLREETLRDRSHLEELLSLCDTQRKIGETSLNETSSRSHQILQLTIESSGREFLSENSSTLTASVSFVDLAGSERASQTLSAGARLKEGCHINRSLLTLGTVIRKLSKGKNRHIPYRDSKLTRILQNSLGGNARTAIICTMSPARSHVEQSRNTLLFASCAKDVKTNARVNLVVSEKALVKQLQRELNELKNLGSASATSDFYGLLKQKEELIEKMKQQIKELTWQRDLAESRAVNLMKSGSEDQSVRTDESSMMSSMDMADLRRTSNDSKGFGSELSYTPSPLWINNYLDLLDTSEEDYFLVDDPCKGFEEVGGRMNKILEDVCKEDRSIGLKNTTIINGKEKRESAEKEDDTTHEELKEKMKKMQRTIEYLIEQLHSPSPDLEYASPGDLILRRSISCKENWSNSELKKSASPALFISKTYDKSSFSFDTQSTISCTSIDAQSVKDSDSEKGRSFHGFMAGLNEMAEKHAMIGSTHELDYGIINGQGHYVSVENSKIKSINNENVADDSAANGLNSSGPFDFERKQKQIIELWEVCNAPLVHRTYFFLLFKGDPSDFVYMEVELRRLAFLKEQESRESDTTRRSVKALMHEKEWLAKQIRKKIRKNKREELYKKWGVGLSTKQRSLQVAHRLWTKAQDMKHIKESASLVARLIGFEESNNTPKEMFGLAMPTKTTNIKSSSGWRFTKSLSRISLT